MSRADKRQTSSRPAVRGAAPARALQMTAGLLLAVTLGVLASVAWPHFFAPERPSAVQQTASAVAVPASAVAVPASAVAAPVSAVAVPPPAVAEPSPAAAVPAAAPAVQPTETRAPQQLPAFSFTSREGALTFSVPQQGDPEYADYQEMLHDPHFRSSLEGLPGYALPYDPEWRSVVTGKRQVGPTPLQLHGGAGSLEALARAYLEAIGTGDEIGVLRLRVSREEWEGILWPEFPQSRPYVRIKPEDAWMLHHATSMSGVQKGLENFRGHTLELVEVTHGETVAYTNFTLVEDVVIRARDQKTQKFVEIPYLHAVVGRNGHYKAYIFEG